MPNHKLLQCVLTMLQTNLTVLICDDGATTNRVFHDMFCINQHNENEYTS
jgi:hypothetical protein